MELRRLLVILVCIDNCTSIKPQTLETSDLALLCHAGIRVSDDKLLQSRVFAYSDAQRYRLGANYQLLPVNAPKCPYKNNHYEGLMNVTQRDEEVCISAVV